MWKNHVMCRNAAVGRFSIEDIWLIKQTDNSKIQALIFALLLSWVVPFQRRETEWRANGLEFRELKKVINCGVVSWQSYGLQSGQKNWAVSKKTDTKWNSSTFYGTVPQKVWNSVPKMWNSSPKVEQVLWAGLSSTNCVKEAKIEYF